jgi:STE24 endopeptidase
MKPNVPRHVFMFHVFMFSCITSSFPEALVFPPPSPVQLADHPMSRVLLIILFLLWLAADQMPVGPSSQMGALALVIFFAGFIAIVAVMAFWSRKLAQRVTQGNITLSLRRFSQGMFYAPIAITAWYAIGIFFYGWYAAVAGRLPWLRGGGAFEAPLLLIGMLPPLAAWAALWWAQYPADRALREQNMLLQLEDDLPLHAPPGFSHYLATNFRLQMLFTVVPILLILIAHDAAMGLWWAAAGHRPDQGIEAGINLAAAAGVFIFAPQILRYVLDTRPLPPSPLRTKLEQMCHRHRLRYRDILLWQTHSSVGNAAVVGIVPPLRYILMSDLLLETMTDEQIEAVFAHEMGHIVHRHMIWYVVFFAVMLLVLAGPGDWIGNQVDQWVTSLVSVTWAPNVAALTLLVLAMAAFLMIFGYISRRFERQADVFAARSLEEGLEFRVQGTGLNPEPRTLHPPPVRPHGATIFASALHRVAVVNNIPIAARSWCHGSLARRMQYLMELSRDPDRTGQFDRTMWRLYAVLAAALVLSGAYLYLISH